MIIVNILKMLHFCQKKKKIENLILKHSIQIFILVVLPLVNVKSLKYAIANTVISWQ